MSDNYIGRGPAPIPDSALGGRMLKSAQHLRGDTAAGNTLLPIDDTIPQITEGVEFFNLPFQPLGIGSRLRVTLHAYVTQNGGGVLYIGGAIFRVGQPDALAACSVILPADNRLVLLRAEIDVITVDLNPITFTGRFGCSAANTTRLNGDSAARFFGGAMNSFLRVDEWGKQ